MSYSSLQVLVYILWLAANLRIVTNLCDFELLDEKEDVRSISNKTKLTGNSGIQRYNFCWQNVANMGPILQIAKIDLKAV